MIVTQEQLAHVAEASWREILAQEQPTGGALARRLTDVGRRIVDASGLTGTSWEFVVFDNPAVNAFVLPGGKVGFFRGIFDLFENDDQLAAVMGHEVGHVIARHAAERMSQAMLAELAVMLGQMAIGESEIPFQEEAAAALGAGVTFGVLLPYSRKHEYEADRLGVDLMGGAGYDPSAALTFWRRMTEQPGEKPLEWLSTHPSDANRIAALQAHLAGAALPAP
jgi:predicted Zn-dependent protease